MCSNHLQFTRTLNTERLYESLMDRYFSYFIIEWTIAFLSGISLVFGSVLVQHGTLDNDWWIFFIGMLILLDILVFIRFIACPFRYPEDFIPNYDDHFELYNDIPADVRSAVWKRDNGRCANCGSDKDISYHRNYASGWNGKNTLETIQIICPECDEG